MSTIPASEIVNVVPSVLAAGGAGLNGTGLILTHNTRVPAGTVQSFANPAAVEEFFGATDPLVGEADVYFAGFSGAGVQPSALLIAQYNQTSVGAYLRGGNVSALTLSQLQAISGSLDVTIDGYPFDAASVNLSSATSFTNAASIIQTALNGSLPTEASVTAAIAEQSANFTASISGNVMTVTTAPSNPVAIGGTISGTGVTSGTAVTGQLSGTAGGEGQYAVSTSQVVGSTSITESYGLMSVTAVGSGTLAVGQTISGGGTAAGTIITEFDGGSGGTGTYYVNVSQIVGSTTLTAEPTPCTVAYDSVSGAFVVSSGTTGATSSAGFASGTAAAQLALTSATGATLSQGAAPETPQAFMTGLVTQNSQWVNFMTHFDPDGGGGSAVKQQFAAWKNTALGGNRFGYFCWDPDDGPANSSDDASSLGRVLKADNDSGTLLVWEGGATSDNGLCAFALGLAASIDYDATNGRTDFAFRQQAGLSANVTDSLTAGNLLANGYCFYGAYGAATQNFIWFQNGQITGPFAWADTWQTQVWLNTSFQTALLTLFENALSVPFTPAGKNLIADTLQTVINQGLDFGAFAPNTLTAAQVQQVNQQAGANIATALQAQGYYLQINIPSQVVQAARGPWPITFWYIDRNSVQSISLQSVEVQ